MTLTFDIIKLTTVKKFTLSKLSHNKASNKKSFDALYWPRCKLKRLQSVPPNHNSTNFRNNTFKTINAKTFYARINKLV